MTSGVTANNAISPGAAEKAFNSKASIMHPHAALANEVGVEALDLEVVGGLDPLGFKDSDDDGAVAVCADQFRPRR